MTIDMLGVLRHAKDHELLNIWANKMYYHSACTSKILIHWLSHSPLLKIGAVLGKTEVEPELIGKTETTR